MAKLDKQNRLHIPKNLLEITTTDFSKEVRVYFRVKEIFLDNPSTKNRRECCLGVVTVDSKGRFFASKLIRDFLGIDSKSNITCFVHQDKITFRKLFFIPENR